MFEIEIESKILIVDDSSAVNELLCYTLSSDKNYEIKSVSSGEEALTLIPVFKPELIILDVFMPGKLDGFATIEQIKSLEEPLCDTPVIFITGETDAKFISKAFNYGAVDYLNKPIFPKEVQARVRLHLEISSLIRSQKEILDKVDKANQLLTEEQIVAKDIFDKIVNKGCLQLDIFKSWISSASIFNGDVLLTKITEDNNLYVFLGDFTGHGLPAAIGIIPLADIFYAMTENSCSLEELVTEANRKLNDNLPAGVFCAAAAYHVDMNSGELDFFNGSVPGSCIVNSSHDVTEMISKNLPIGVLHPDNFKPTIECYQIFPGDRIYIYTDGIAEAKNINEELFGKERFHSILKLNDASNCFNTIKYEVEGFFEGKQEDDITLLEFTFPNQSTLKSLSAKKIG